MANGIFKTALQAVLRKEGDRIMEEIKSKTPVWYEGQLAGWDTGAMKRPSSNHWRNPIILDSGTSSIGEPVKTHYAFICTYCGRASESVEPCQGCGAIRTREQLELWARIVL